MRVIFLAPFQLGPLRMQHRGVVRRNNEQYSYISGGDKANADKSLIRTYKLSLKA